MLAELRGTAGGKKGETFRQIETIIANMERWRWYSRDLGSAHRVPLTPPCTAGFFLFGNQGCLWV